MFIHVLLDHQVNINKSTFLKIEIHHKAIQCQILIVWNRLYSIYTSLPIENIFLLSFFFTYMQKWHIWGSVCKVIQHLRIYIFPSPLQPQNKTFCLVLLWFVVWFVFIFCFLFCFSHGGVSYLFILKYEYHGGGFPCIA